MIDMKRLYEFIKNHYRNDRFEGRNNKDWGVNYSDNIVNSYLVDLERYGVAFISMHESSTGQQIRFDKHLNILQGQ